MDRQSRELDIEKAQFNSLGNEIERIRPYVDKTSQDALDQFNSKIKNYNYIHSQLERKYDAFNREVDQYNLELGQVGGKY